jgi:hypothetical protein
MVRFNSTVGGAAHSEPWAPKEELTITRLVEAAVLIVKGIAPSMLHYDIPTELQPAQLGCPASQFLPTMCRRDELGMPLRPVASAVAQVMSILIPSASPFVSHAPHFLKHRVRLHIRSLPHHNV